MDTGRNTSGEDSNFIYEREKSTYTPATTEISEQKPVHHQIKKPSLRRAHLLVAVSIALILIVAWQGLAYYKDRQAVTVPADILQSADFPLYVPADTFKVVPDSYNYSNGVFIYQAVPDDDGSTDTYTVSEQAKPAGFDTEDYKTSQGLTEIKEIKVAAGTAISGKMQTRTVLILVTDKTLVSITAAAAVSGELHMELARNLVQQKR